MKILMFDRLSRALVITGFALAGLGFILAFIKNRGHYSEALWFWAFLLITLITLVLLGWLASSDLEIRVAGMIFQLLGIGVALFFLVDVRSQLNQPGILAKFTEFMASPALVEAPAVRSGAAMVAEASDIVSAQGTLTTHPKSMPAEERFTAIENQLARVESTHAAEMAAISRTIRDNRQLQDSRHQEQVAAVSTVKDLIVRLQTGGFAFAFFGIIWLALGAALTSIPDLILKCFETFRLH